ncbi:molybdate ABC transporter substrate-binding protein [Bradyrhizobium viridifuturi]|jgi:molybdate transport system substrate-binding protein|nr:molybdate ABC transporter substrate-binding protein [Bradyrhizobium viridifuturi]MBR1048635.1 molybdate ABC transporter substrate-binding protein [Bradyrhizobium viridifuturi]MBR1083738.1 molybdate ABC transporter substrate-binding protein [Bradyrhizobium viridifuturi]MBR1099202.1 molybdate ABC transporter substrate-binding protein [Bradyrhizobium viridifuturi]MBR1106358.1 molybdate ABC transporter substrate-binding protein [Bradyrhizobium viridifuturi]
MPKGIDRISAWTRRSVVVLSLGLALLGASALISNVAAQQTQPPNIAAAADLKFALDEIAAAFTRDTGKTVTLSFGSSGNFLRQIQQGAPFQMFMSADEGYVRQLAEAGKTVDDGTLYAIGRIVLFAPKGSPLMVDPELKDFRAALADGRIQRFAIANPEHAPYGRAAEQALRSRGLWEAVQPRLVLGENVAQAAQFATLGSAQGGIFSYSLALSQHVRDLGSFVLLPAEWHQPLRQRMVLLKGANATARAFFAYVQQPAARTIFRKYGFVLPGESS